MATRKLTHRPFTREVIEDEQTGKVVARHETTVITDPEGPDAVQFGPYPADGRAHDPLRRGFESEEPE